MTIDHIGVIGLGAMGSAIAMNLIAADQKVVGYDPSASARNAMEAAGGEVVLSARDLATKCRTILTCVPSIEAFDGLLADASFIDSLSPGGATLIDTSTLPLDIKQRGARRLEVEGHCMLDCTISGNRPMMLQHRATILASGDSNEVDKARLLLDSISPWRFVGAFGNASRLKFIQNHLVTIHTAAAAEAMAFGIKAGIDPELIYSVVCSSGASSAVFQVRGKMMVEEDYTSSQGNYHLVEKDAKIIDEFARACRFPIPLFAAANQIHSLGFAANREATDPASLCSILESVTGAQRKTPLT
jgi:L-threonate 2-dehydrogenase